MSDRIEIPPGGGAAVHVFGLDLGGEAAAAFVRKPVTENGAGWPLRVALGADHLDPAHIEHFPASDLAGVGLPGYLTEGMGLDAGEVEAARDRLEAVTGDVVILRPAAFGGKAQVLTPEAPLTHAGSFDPDRPATTMERLHSPSAEGQILTGAYAPPAPGSRMLKWMAALAAAVIVIGLLVLLAGGSG